MTGRLALTYEIDRVPLSDWRSFSEIKVGSSSHFFNMKVIHEMNELIVQEAMGKHLRCDFISHEVHAAQWSELITYSQQSKHLETVLSPRELQIKRELFFFQSEV